LHYSCPMSAPAAALHWIANSFEVRGKRELRRGEGRNTVPCRSDS